GEEPARIRLDALERTNVVLEINVPARSVGILLPLVPRWNRIQIRFPPKTFRQRREAEPGVELLGRLDDPFRLPALEILVDVGGINQTFPFLGPTIVNPVSRDLLRDRLMILFRE